MKSSDSATQTAFPTPVLTGSGSKGPPITSESQPLTQHPQRDIGAILADELVQRKGRALGVFQARRSTASLCRQAGLTPHES